MFRVHDDSAHFVIKLLVISPHTHTVDGTLSTYGREVRDAETSYIAQAILRQQGYLTYKVYDAKI